MKKRICGEGGWRAEENTLLINRTVVLQLFNLSSKVGNTFPRSPPPHPNPASPLPNPSRRRTFAIFTGNNFSRFTSPAPPSIPYSEVNGLYVTFSLSRQLRKFEPAIWLLLLLPLKRKKIYSTLRITRTRRRFAEAEDNSINNTPPPYTLLANQLRVAPREVRVI